MLQKSLLMSDNLDGILPVPARTGINLQIPAGISAALEFRYICRIDLQCTDRQQRTQLCSPRILLPTCNCSIIFRNARDNYPNHLFHPQRQVTLAIGQLSRFLVFLQQHRTDFPLTFLTFKLKPCPFQFDPPQL